MSKQDSRNDLSRRERQIMDALYTLGKATAADVREGISDPPSYTAVRTLLTILEEKGHITHQAEGPRYVYETVIPRDQVAKSAIQGVVKTFFEGSVERVVATLLDSEDSKLTNEELDRLSELIEQAKREGR